MTKNFSKVKNDVWETPDDYFHLATDIFGVFPKLDVCATEKNRKCEFYFDESTDGLKQTWFYDSWMNCPYSNASKWIYKAYEESQKNNINVLALLNVTTDTKAFHDCILENKAEIYFIKGRIKFIKDGNLSTQASQHPSCFVCWRKTH